MIYEGSPKHKEHPHLFRLPPNEGRKGDATLCDRDANFSPQDMKLIVGFIHRGLEAGLVGENDMFWAVADNGWIMEAGVTNRSQAQYHGYPLLPSEPIAEKVYDRFREWADNFGTHLDRQAAMNCQFIYGF